MYKYRAMIKPLQTRAVRILSLILAFSIPCLVQADDEDVAKPPKLFDSDEIIAITLSAPWQDIVRNKEFQGTYPATIEYKDHDGNVVKHELTVERRGIKRQATCRFPPIKLRFEKEEVKGSYFRGETSLKLVTHCENSERYDQYYLLEMMAYRIYNQVTDFSFLVQPLSITYRDSEDGDVEEDRFGFLIEDDGDVAKRNGLKKLEIDKVVPSRLDHATLSDLSIFQFLIGNTDWSPLIGPDPIECCHNVKLVAPRPLEAGDLIWPVPYDFDASGIVDAPYAVPPESLGINSVTQRVYRGYCAHNATLQDSRQKYIDRKAAIMAVLDSDPRLTERSKKKASRFLKMSFDLIESDKEFERLIVKRCRK